MQGMILLMGDHPIAGILTLEVHVNQNKIKLIKLCAP
jgi:hypothetical protein